MGLRLYGYRETMTMGWLTHLDPWGIVLIILSGSNLNTLCTHMAGTGSVTSPTRSLPKLVLTKLQYASKYQAGIRTVLIFLMDYFTLQMPLSP